MDWEYDSLASRRMILSLAAGAVATATLGRSAMAQRIKTKARIVIIGAGAAGTAIANRLSLRLENATITVIDGRRNHIYQPGLSLVAAGLRPRLLCGVPNDGLAAARRHADRGAGLGDRSGGQDRGDGRPQPAI